MSKKFFAETMREDVRSLYHCLSRPMFVCLAEIVQKAWMEKGEKSIANTFFKSYVTTEKYNVWYCTASGLTKCTPNNTVNERNTLYIKGSRTEDSLCAVGRASGTMISEEWLKAIYALSMDNAGVDRNVLVDNEDIIMQKTMLIVHFRKMQSIFVVIVKRIRV